ncbi:MAG: hypothetical protein LUE65_11870 [Clostridiales bacterium]|nr:hypothetical protein [Clostridiales bacterium]
MTNETMKTSDLETVLERTVRKMDTKCSYLLEFWKKNDISFMVRVDARQAFFNQYAGYFAALSDVGLFESDDLESAYAYLNVFMSQLDEAVREVV